MGKTLDNNDLNQVVAFSGFSENKDKALGAWCSVSRAHKTWSRSLLGMDHQKSDGGRGWGKSQKKISPENYQQKKYIPADLGHKKYAQGGSVQVSLTITGQLYEENDKSKLENKRDIFNLNMTVE